MLSFRARAALLLSFKSLHRVMQFTHLATVERSVGFHYPLSGSLLFAAQLSSLRRHIEAPNDAPNNLSSRL